MGHTSNARIFRVSKLLTGIGDFNAEYNSEEIYSNSKQSKSNNDAKIETIQKTPELLTTFAFHVIENNFDNICIPCIASK